MHKSARPNRCRMRRGVAILVVAWIVCDQSIAQQMIFPGDDWQTAAPESVLIDSDQMQQAVASIDPNDKTLIVKNGRVIWAGENVHQPWAVFSVTKTFTSTALGLLIDDGVLTLDTPVSEYVPELAQDYPDVTFRHLVTHTSGYRGTTFVPQSPWFTPPGSQFKYGESFDMLGNAVSRAAGEPISELFAQRIAEPTGMNLSAIDWPELVGRDGFVVNQGASNLRISADNAARLGHLFLNAGNWDGTQLISSNWVDVATQVQVERIPSHPQSGTLGLGPGIYGYGWWISGNWYEAIGFNNNYISVNAVNGTVIAALDIESGLAFHPEYTSFRSAIGAASIPAIWDDQGDGRWDDVDATTGKPRWITETGLVPDIYPTSKAIIRSNAVSIPESLAIASDGFIAIEDGAALVVDGSLDANAIDVGGGGTLVVDGPFTARNLTLADGTAILHDTQSPVLVSSRLDLGVGSQLRFVIADETWDSPITFTDPRRPPAFAGDLILDFDAISHPNRLVGATLNFFDWLGPQPSTQFGKVIVSDAFQIDLSRLYTDGEVVVNAVPEPHGLIICGVAMLCAVWFVCRCSGDCPVSAARVSTCLLFCLGIPTDCHAQFTTVINVPPDAAPASIGPNTQLNVFDGGVVSGGIRIEGVEGAAAEVDIHGGTIQGIVRLFGNRNVTIAGGSIDSISAEEPGNKLDISGGTFGSLGLRGFPEPMQNDLTIHGNDFRLNGIPIDGPNAVGNTVVLREPRDVLTGILSDGTPFHIGAHSDIAIPEIFWLGTSVTLQASSLPPIDPSIIAASSDHVPWGIREGQTLIVDAGSVVGKNFVAGSGSSVHIQELGTVGENLEAIGAHVTMSGGSIGNWLGIYQESNVTISGGRIEGFAEALDSQVSISRGSIDWFDMWNSELRLSGGTIGELRLSNNNLPSHTTFVGAEFLLNGTPIEPPPNGGDTLQLDNFKDEAILSGVLADGTPFGHRLRSKGTVTLEFATPLGVGPSFIDASADDVPAGIREGQTIVVGSNGVLPENFVAGRGSRLILQNGAVVGDRLKAVGAYVAISGESESGTLMVDVLNVVGGSQVDMTGGSVHSVDAWDASQIRISGGRLDGFITYSESEALIIGGAVADEVFAQFGSKIVISGGEIGHLGAGPASQLEIFGTEFFVNGRPVSVDGLGRPERLHGGTDVPLTGRLADGSNFEFDLTRIDNGATLIVSLVSLLDGDYNSNGIVDQADLDLVLLNWGEELFNPYAAGWINDVPNGPIDQEELDRVLLNWGTSVQPLGTASVPEPSSAAILSILFVLSAAYRLRAALTRLRRPANTLGCCILLSEVSHAQFDTIINVPPDAVPAAIGSNTQLNVLDGGILPSSFDMPFQAGLSDGSSTNIEVNVSGGDVGEGLTANAGSALNISSGNLGRFTANPGSVVNISGGNVGGFVVSSSIVSISGGEVIDDLGIIADATHVEISGGLVGNDFAAFDSEVVVSGGTLGNADVDDPFYLSGASFFYAEDTHVIISGGKVLGGIFIRDSELDVSGGTITYSPTISSEIHGSNVTFSGGKADDNFHVSEQSRATVSGGSVRSLVLSEQSRATVTGGSLRFLVLSDGSQAIISDGFVGGVRAGETSHATWTGGGLQDDNFVFGSALDVSEGGAVDLFGGEFHLDGVPIEGLADIGDSVVPTFGPVRFPRPLLSGVLSDGTPFAIHPYRIADGTLTLVNTELPPIGPPRITASTDQIPHGIREGQILVADAGGAVGPGFYAAPGSAVQVEEGGAIGDHFEGRDAEIVISGGSVGDWFEARAGTRATISGGTVGDYFSADAGSQVTISGGTVGDSFHAVSGFDGTPRVAIRGSDFRVDGVEIEGLSREGDRLPLDLPQAGAVLFSGILADGTPFAFYYYDNDYFELTGDNIAVGTLTLEWVAPPPIGPPLIVASTDAVPLGIRTGQTLVVDEGGFVGDNFNAGSGSKVVVEDGGTVGKNLEAVDAIVTITGGTVGDQLDAFAGTTMVISGGSVGDRFDALRGSDVTISGGEVGDLFYARGGSRVRISGGTVGNELNVQPSSQVSISGGVVESVVASGQVIISGGSVAGPYFALPLSQTVISGGTIKGSLNAAGEFGASFVRIFGTDFLLAGKRLVDAKFGDEMTIRTRDVELSGTLADGSQFSFQLNSAQRLGDFFDRNSTLTVTLVSLLDGDYDSNGTVEQADLDLVLLNWEEKLFDPFEAGWINDLPKGVIDQEELDKLLLNWGTSVEPLAAARVPEPATVGLLLLALAGVKVILQRGNQTR